MAKAVVKRYLLNILVWATNSLNVWAAPFLNWLHDTDRYGDPDECTSSVLGKLWVYDGKATWLREFVDYAFWLLTNQPNHCVENIEEDEGRK